MDLNYVYKVKIKLAELVVEKGLYTVAKSELETVIKYRSEKNQSLPDSIEKITRLVWYEKQPFDRSNRAFYLQHCKKAEELLYSDIEWEKAILGKSFSLNSKPMWKLYISTEDWPFETIIPEHRLDIAAPKPGMALRVRGETDNEGRFQVYTTEARDSAKAWDVFEEYVGVVDHVNKDKRLIHYIVSTDINGVVPFTELDNAYEIGDSISVRVASYMSKTKGRQLTTLTASKTTSRAATSVFKLFSAKVTVSNGLGFTSDDIFIPPSMVSFNNLADGSLVSGHAVLNYNKKKSLWGWKALSIETVS